MKVDTLPRVMGYGVQSRFPGESMGRSVPLRRNGPVGVHMKSLTNLEA